jgi:hypothetical protein
MLGGLDRCQRLCPGAGQPPRKSFVIYITFSGGIYVMLLSLSAENGCSARMPLPDNQVAVDGHPLE